MKEMNNEDSNDFPKQTWLTLQTYHEGKPYIKLIHCKIEIDETPGTAKFSPFEEIKIPLCEIDEVTGMLQDAKAFQQSSELRNKNGTVKRYPNKYLSFLLGLAEDFGWDWGGSVFNRFQSENIYAGEDLHNPDSAARSLAQQVENTALASGGRTVPANDARGIAAALERVLRVIPAERFRSGSDDEKGEEDSIVELTREEVKEFVEFCQQGEFQIL